MKTYLSARSGWTRRSLLGVLLGLSLIACTGETVPSVIDTSCTVFWEHTIRDGDTLATKREATEHNAVFNSLCP